MYAAGQTYYFTIVVKETNSDSVKYVYYCTLKMLGTVIVKNMTINYTDVNYTINWFSNHSTGSMLFNVPVNMVWIKANFYKMFKIYWRATTYRDDQLNRTLLDFTVDDWGTADNRTINFTMVFEEPYMIGLLLKKSDKLYIDLNDGFNYTKMFYGNLSEIRLVTTTANAALPMTFDWNNEKMALMRSIAKNMYWGMIALIASQFIMLMLRRVGLLPVWILIEYLQLIAFMPIYNFRLIPYLYDAFKPALVSHMILFDQTPLYDDLDNDYFNANYEFYWLSVGKLFQAFFWGGVILVIILILNLTVFIFTKCNIQNAKCKAWF